MPCICGTSAAAGKARCARRSMPGASPRLNRWYWPSLTDTRSRGYRRACSSCSAIARAMSPSTQAATAATKRRSRSLGLWRSCLGGVDERACVERALARLGKHVQRARSRPARSRLRRCSATDSTLTDARLAGDEALDEIVQRGQGWRVLQADRVAQAVCMALLGQLARVRPPSALARLVTAERPVRCVALIRPRTAPTGRWRRSACLSTGP